MSNLTPKQERFVTEYLIDFNGTQAAIRAGYSESTARQTASENLTKPDIQEALKAAKAEYAKQHGVTIGEVTEMHRKAYRVALEAGNPGAMTTAAQNLAKLHGLIVDRAETKVTLKQSEWIDIIAKANEGGTP